jgi:lipopolysaccharide biosynthesis glycosyltransferase
MSTIFETIRPKKNAIVMCCTATHIPYATVTFLSCRDHGSADVADLHLIVLDATEKDETKFKDFVTSQSLDVSLHRVEVDQTAHEIDHNGYTIGSILRLYMDRFISHHYERVLYLDTDILAVGPVSLAFGVDLRGKPLGAVEDIPSITLPNGIRRGVDYFRSLGLTANSKYFNSGVLLFDWKAVVASGRLQNCIKTGLHMRAAGIAQKFADQDILNVEFEGDWLPLNAKYNAMPLYAPHLVKPIVFQHFAGFFKPWDDMLNPPSLWFGSTYKAYLKNSPWKLPRRLKWKRDTEFSFRDHFFNKFSSSMRRAIRAQFPVN